MPDTQFLSQAGALLLAQRQQTYLIDSVVHLFQSTFTPAPGNVLADYLAAECDFDGYAPKTIAAWNEIVAAASTAFIVFAPTQTWIWAHVSLDVGNMVGGHFIVSAAGDLVDVVIYDPPIPMQGPFQSVVKTPSELISN
jgi:hypothetical protein